jgi:hypothetical protein
MRQPNDLPLVCVPTELSGAAAAKLVEFLYEIIEALDRHYDSQMRDYHNPGVCQRDLDFVSPPTEPPF